MHEAVQRVGKRRGRGCLPDEQGPGRHGVGEDGDRPAVGVTAQVRGTLSSRSVETCGHRGLCPSRRAFAGPIFSIAGDGDSPGRLELPHGRARGTVPLPGNPQIGGSPAHSPSRDEPHLGGPLEGDCNSLPVASRCAGHPACCSGKRLRNALADTNCRHRVRDMLCALSFGRSPCPLCLCGSIPPCLRTDRTGCRGRCGRRWW
jgi:hypothetical protein